ncbi:MAG: hypothetical protein HeimC3_37600 [Candidatus Heimdallarchaeota archaeon LC_3]|nr:MAG: hypothetical protein HeimC3_37600 [Candidatus Heimdallarchaeota archaeon LC_3]
MKTDFEYLFEFLRFIVYQQFYRDPDIIVNRTKSQKITIPNSSNVISAFLTKCKPPLQYWDSDRPKFFHLFREILKIDLQPVLDYFQSQFNINVLSENVDSLDPKEMVSLVLSKIYGQFYEKKINEIYNSIAQKEWKREERFGLIVNEYSLLVNILYLQELAVFTGVHLKMSILIRKLLNAFKSLDREKFLLIQYNQK